MKGFFTYIKYRLYCKKNLERRRYLHSLSAGRMFYRLENGRVSRTLSMLLGLFHDIAHSWDYDRLINYIDANSLELMAGERDEKMLLHAIAGAHMFLSRVPFAEGEHFDILRYHTSPKKGLSDSCYNFFVADKIDSTREHITDEFRRGIIAESNAGKRCLAVLKREDEFLKSKNKTFIPETQALFEYLEEKYVGL